jgi:hypothetical protein
VRKLQYPFFSFDRLAFVGKKNLHARALEPFSEKKHVSGSFIQRYFLCGGRKNLPFIYGTS